MDKKNLKTRIEFKGKGLSGGVAIGKAFLLKPIDLTALSRNRFPVEDTEAETIRFVTAKEKSLFQIENILRHVETYNNSQAFEIFSAQRLFLKDESFLNNIRDRAITEMVNLEHILALEIQALKEKFNQISDDKLQSRFSDIEDVYHRLLRNLLDIEHVRVKPLSKLAEPVIFITDKILPSDMALMDYRNILGVAMTEGSVVSHVSIICRSLDIPAIADIDGAYDIIRNNDLVLLNGDEGTIVLNPRREEIDAFKQSPKNTRSFPAFNAQDDMVSVCSTIDGREITLEGNAGSLKEVERAARLGATGIGLFRTELFYMSRTGFPEEHEEVSYYKGLLKEMNGGHLTLRLLDLGADKIPPYLKTSHEENPQLGLRGVRFLLNHPDLFNSHLKRVLLASQEGSMRVLIPFVSSLEEVEQVLERINTICHKEGLSKKGIKTGIMVEIPSAALSISDYIDMVDFVSIGSNDLCQYLFAASREDPDMKRYLKPYHPVFLRLIKNITVACEAKGKPVYICGEIAADPKAALIFLGLNVTGLSMSPESIPVVREIIRSKAYKECLVIADEALRFRTNEEVLKLLEKIG